MPVGRRKRSRCARRLLAEAMAAGEVATTLRHTIWRCATSSRPGLEAERRGPIRAGPTRRGPALGSTSRRWGRPRRCPDGLRLPDRAADALVTWAAGPGGHGLRGSDQRRRAAGDPREVAVGRFQLGSVRLLQRRYGEALTAYDEARQPSSGWASRRGSPRPGTR